MDKPPPPPSPTLNSQQKGQDKGSLLPISSRYPVLVSGQVSFTTEAALKDIEQAPKNVYRLQVELQPRTNDTNFSDAPWTLVARHFFSTIQLYDDTAIIIRKKAKAVANKISSPEELPENPDDFERDYAYDVKLKSARSVTFKIIIGTKQPYWKTFRKEGPLFAKLVSNDWYVKYVRLENQGTVASIGHLMYAHNRYVNQEDVINEIKQLIYPTQCNQIDVCVTKSKEYYFTGNKKTRVFTRWLTIDCPVDIASELSTLIMERWKTLKTDPKFNNYNLKNTLYVPRDKGLVKFNARIENIGKQNEFLRTYKDVTVLTNVSDIEAIFNYTEKMGTIFKDSSKIGHKLKLRSFLGSWEDNSTGNPAIIAIHRTNKTKEYSLLSGNENMTSIHQKIRDFINELRKQDEFNKVRVGGTKGAMSNQNHSTEVASYAQENFSTEKMFQQRPSKDAFSEKIGAKEKEQQEEDKWKSPPLIGRKTQKATKASTTFNFNDQRLVQEYKDVVVGNSYSNNNQGVYSGQINTVPKSGNKIDNNKESTNYNNTVTIHDGTQTGTITNTNERTMINQQALQQLLESKQFQLTLAKAVAPQVTKQVTSIITPTIEKISHIETEIGELNNYVRGNNEWQGQQTCKQDNLQNSINQMQSSMNALLTLYKEEKEKEMSNKRGAENHNLEPITPTRKQKTNQTHLTNTPMENINQYIPTQYDDEVSNLHHNSQSTFTEESVDEAMTSYANGEGEGQ